MDDIWWDDYFDGLDTGYTSEEAADYADDMWRYDTSSGYL